MGERTMWAVGTDSGDYDWQAINAPSREAAIAAYAEEHGHIKCERWAEGKSGPCVLPCDWCGAEERQGEPRGDLDAERVEAWDRLRMVKPADWIRVGLGAHCDWCGHATRHDEGGAVVRGKATCEDCRQRKPWRAARPDEKGE